MKHIERYISLIWYWHNRANRAKFCSPLNEIQFPDIINVKVEFGLHPLKLTCLYY